MTTGTNESSNLYICRKHFENKCYLSTNTKKIKPGSIPTLFLNNATLHRERRQDSLSYSSEKIECEPIFNNFEVHISSTSPLLTNEIGPSLLEASRPWRFDFEIDNNSISSGVANDSCSDKFYLLHVIQDLRKELNEIKNNNISNIHIRLLVV